MSGNSKVQRNENGLLSTQNRLIYTEYLQALKQYFTTYVDENPDQSDVLSRLLTRQISTKSPISVNTVGQLADALIDLEKGSGVMENFIAPSLRQADGMSQYFGGQNVPLYLLLLNTKILIPALSTEGDFGKLLKV